MKIKLLLCLAFVLSGGLFGCATKQDSAKAFANKSVSKIQFQSSGIQKPSKIILSATTEISTDGVPYLILSLKNAGDIQISMGEFHEFDEISVQIWHYQQRNNVWLLVEPRPLFKQPNPTTISLNYLYRPLWPSEITSWRYPINRYYDLHPGLYGITATVQFDIEADRSLWPFSASVGPVELDIK